jgi:hypothetical protein
MVEETTVFHESFNKAKKKKKKKKHCDRFSLVSDIDQSTAEQAKLVPTFTDRACHIVSVTDPYGLILGFLDWSRHSLFQGAPQSYLRC